jgi:hypothetical protein
LRLWGFEKVSSECRVANDEHVDPEYLYPEDIPILLVTLVNKPNDVSRKGKSMTQKRKRALNFRHMQVRRIHRAGLCGFSHPPPTEEVQSQI